VAKAPKGWDPIQMYQPNPKSPAVRAFLETGGQQHHYCYREPQRAVEVRAYGNRLYNGVAVVFEDGSMHLSFKRNDRAAVRDWRHFQAIKNEVAGPEREAIEIFPPESNLVDAANEYHLFVLPEGVQSPLGFDGGPAVLDANDTMDWAAYLHAGGQSGARQRAWEDGIPTGLGLKSTDQEEA
jgi:hypothetical protein